MKTCSPWQMKLLTIRLCIAYPSWLMLYFSVSVLPIGLNQVIQNLIPFTTLIISYFSLRETLKPLEIINMCVSFAGVLFIIANSNRQSKSNIVDDGPSNSGIFYLGVLCNIGCVTIASSINVIVRSLKAVH